MEFTVLTENQTPQRFTDVRRAALKPAAFLPASGFTNKDRQQESVSAKGLWPGAAPRGGAALLHAADTTSKLHEPSF